MICIELLEFVSFALGLIVNTKELDNIQCSMGFRAALGKIFSLTVLK